MLGIRTRSFLLYAITGLVMLMAAGHGVNVAADTVPQRVSVQAFIKPEGSRLDVLMRVPMNALGEINFPVRGSPGNLVFSEAQAAKEQAVDYYIERNIRFYEGDRRLENPTLEGSRISMPSDSSFTDYESALENIRSQPLSDDVNLYYQQGYLDVWLSYPIQSEDSRFSVDPRMATLGVETTTVLHYVMPDGGQRSFSYIGNPGRVYLDPRWYQAALNFVDLGFDHILEGTDHLLFIFCLVIPLRRVRALVPVVTSFTIAHSITLIAAAFEWVPSAIWFPSLIETLIALSIVYMAFENIIGVNHQHRWLLTFGFGLVHGFGFSFLLSESMQFAGSHLVTSLLAFNVGVELGQLLVLALMAPVLHLLFRHALPERMGVILLSALVAHTAWHWMTDRFADFTSYDLQLPALNAAFFAALMQWLMLMVIAGGVLWGMYELFNRFFGPDTPVGSQSAAER